MSFPNLTGGNGHYNWLCVITSHCSSNPFGWFCPSLRQLTYTRVLISALLSMWRSTQQSTVGTCGAVVLQDSSFFPGVLPYRLELPCFPLVSQMVLPTRWVPQAPSVPLPARRPSNAQSSELGQSQGSPCLFPIHEGLLSVVGWHLGSEISFHEFCLSDYFRWEGTYGPYCSVMPRSRSLDIGISYYSSA